jgi:hypothetical protein
MKTKKLKGLVLGIAVASMLTACGGGSDAPAPPTASQTAIGTISGFGSVIVNGVRFSDGSAAITKDGATMTRDQLRVGMVVQVSGQIHADGTGTANRIQYSDCVQGPITAMNQVQNTVTVLGQTVQVDDGTVFDGVTLRDMNGFAIGDQIEVSCQSDAANNRLRATRMERLGAFQNGVSALDVKGAVSNLNLVASTFTIDGLTVNFAGIAAGSVPTGLANGMRVQASGSSFINGTLTADRLRDRDRDRISYPDGDGLVVEGYVSDFVSIASFKIDGQAVNATDATIKNGTAADIRNGLKVAAEGTVSNDVLMATKLVVKLQPNVRVEAGLQAKDSTQSTVTVLGRAIVVNTDTELRDASTGRGQPTVITLASLGVADRLEVNAYQDSTGGLIATRVLRTAADDLVLVKGPASAKTPTTQLTLAGFGVTTGANTRYRDASGNLIDATSFYDAVLVPPAVPTIVNARGAVADLATSVLDATRSVSTTGEVEIAAGN